MLFPICLLGKAELYYLSTYSLTFAALKLPTRVVYWGALISEGFWEFWYISLCTPSGNYNNSYDFEEYLSHSP